MAESAAFRLATRMYLEKTPLGVNYSQKSWSPHNLELFSSEVSTCFSNVRLPCMICIYIYIYTYTESFSIAFGSGHHRENDILDVGSNT